MKFHLGNGLGDSLDEPTREQMRAFLQAVDVTDEEHGRAWLPNDDDVLEWNGDGRMIYERDEDSGVRHLGNISKEVAVDLWVALAEGRFDDLERHPWKPGNGYVLTPEREAEIAAWQLAIDRQFYDAIGPEDSERPCAHPGCSRRSIRVGVFCKPHHFESIRKKPSPFDD